MVIFSLVPVQWTEIWKHNNIYAKVDSDQHDDRYVILYTKWRRDHPGNLHSFIIYHDSFSQKTPGGYVFENIGFSNIWISSMVLLVSSRMEKYKCGRPRLVLKMNWSLLFYKRIVGVGGREIFYCLYLILSGASLFQLHMKKRKLLFWCYSHFKVSTSKVHDFDW